MGHNFFLDVVRMRKQEKIFLLLTIFYPPSAHTKSVICGNCGEENQSQNRKPETPQNFFLAERPEKFILRNRIFFLILWHCAHRIMSSSRERATREKAKLPFFTEAAFLLVIQQQDCRGYPIPLAKRDHTDLASPYSGIACLLRRILSCPPESPMLRYFLEGFFRNNARRASPRFCSRPDFSRPAVYRFYRSARRVRSDKGHHFFPWPQAAQNRHTRHKR